MTQTVLIIDDSEAVRHIASDMLGLLDVQVHTAVNGPAGIAHYQQSPADLVLLDMNMPEMDGVETFRALQSINPDVQVIICTSDSKLKAAMRFGELSLPPYLHKPFDTTIFLETVEALLKKALR